MRLRLHHLGVVVLFTGVFFLGMPLTGRVPYPAISVETEASAEQLLATSLFWGGFYAFCLLVCVVRPDECLRIFRRLGPVAGLAAWMIASMLWSLSPTTSGLLGAQLTGSLVFATTVAISFRSRLELLRRVLMVAFAASLAANLIAILLSGSNTVDALGRWTGVTGSANFLGSLSASAVVVFCWCLVGTRGWSRVGVEALCGAAVLTLLRSGSTTSLLAAIAALGAMLFRLAPGRRILASLGTFVAFLGVALTLLVPLRLPGIEAMLSWVGSDPTLAGRTALWRAGWSSFLARPVLGSGFGSSTDTLGVLSRSTSLHNGYLQVAVDGGMTALVLLFVWLGLLARRGLRPMPAAPHAEILLWAALVLAAVHNLAESSWLLARSPVWLTLLLAAAIAAGNDVGSRDRGTSRIALP